MIWVLRLFGYLVLTFGPESALDGSEDLTAVDNTGGYFELASDEYSPEYDEEDRFGFGSR